MRLMSDGLGDLKIGKSILELRVVHAKFKEMAALKSYQKS